MHIIVRHTAAVTIPAWKVHATLMTTTGRNRSSARSGYIVRNGTQITQWHFQNKGTLTSPLRLSFVLKIALRCLLPSIIYSVPCDGTVQRAYILAFVETFCIKNVNLSITEGIKASKELDLFLLSV